MDKVAAFLDATTHPRRDVLLALRGVILGAAVDLAEHIKWNAPSYQAAGEDRITFNLSSPDAVQIVFHRGAKAKDTKTGVRLVDDRSGRLKWATDQRAVTRFASLDEVTAGADWLAGFVETWIAAVLSDEGV